MVVAVVQGLWSDDDFQGHETRAQRDARMLRSFRFWADTLASLALGAILVYWCRVLSGERFLAANPIGAVVFWGGALVAASFVIQYFWWDAVRRVGRVRALMVLTPVFILVCVIPAVLEYRDYRKAMVARRAAMIDWDAVAQSRRHWLADIRNAGLVARPLLTPPMLDVEEVRHTVVVENVSDAPLCVAVARGDSHARCPLQTAAREACAQIEPGGRREFSWRSSADFGPCARLPLDIRVGDSSHDGALWWSAASLREAEEQEQAEHRARQAFIDKGVQDAALFELTLQQIQAETARLRSLPPVDARRDSWPLDAAQWRAQEQQQLWDALRMPGSAALSRELARQEAERRQQQIAELRAAGATGVANEAPPMLEVRDQFSLLRVRSRSEEPLVVRITRLGSHHSLGEPFVCFAQAAGEKGRSLFAVLAPRQTQTFLFANVEACEPAGRSPVEYEVRDRHGSLVWASDSVLARMEKEAADWLPAAPSVTD